MHTGFLKGMTEINPALGVDLHTEAGGGKEKISGGGESDLFNLLKKCFV